MKDSRGISILREVEKGDITSVDKENIHNFFIDLVDLCNKYRTCLAIDKIFTLPSTSFLKVAGFSFDAINKVTLPVYVDTRLEDKNEGVR